MSLPEVMSNNDETTEPVDEGRADEVPAETNADQTPDSEDAAGDVVGEDDSPEVEADEESPTSVEPESQPDTTERDRSAAHDEVFCSSCGESIKREAEVCPHCGVRQTAASGSNDLNPGISAIASLIVPGAGQIYNGQMGRGAVAFLGAIVADTLITVLALVLTLIVIGPLFFLLIPVVHLGIAYDAYTQAEKINNGEITV